MRELRWIDKAAWGPGGWQDEPDKVQWADEATGLVCLAVRNEQIGNWCGYVGVPFGHPDHERHYDDVKAEAHGGLTFSGFCQEDDLRGRERGICHIPEPGQPERIWWLGFDCAHLWDYTPGAEAFFRSIGHPRERDPKDIYRDLAYVRAECANLARQLARGAEEPTP